MRELHRLAGQLRPLDVVKMGMPCGHAYAHGLRMAIPSSNCNMCRIKPCGRLGCCRIVTIHRSWSLPSAGGCRETQPEISAFPFSGAGKKLVSCCRRKWSSVPPAGIWGARRDLIQSRRKPPAYRPSFISKGGLQVPDRPFTSTILQRWELRWRLVLTMQLCRTLTQTHNGFCIKPFAILKRAIFR